MKYFKNTFNGYIVSVSTMQGQTEITKKEYDEILETIKTIPIAESGFGYRLKNNLTWEVFELPKQDESENENF